MTFTPTIHSLQLPQILTGLSMTRLTPFLTSNLFHKEGKETVVEVRMQKEREAQGGVPVPPSSVGGWACLQLEAALLVIFLYSSFS